MALFKARQGGKNRRIAQQRSEGGLRRERRLLRYPGNGGGALNMAAGRRIKARQQTQQTRLADAVPADQAAKGRFQRDAERTKQGLSRRKLTGDLM